MRTYSVYALHDLSSVLDLLTEIYLLSLISYGEEGFPSLISANSIVRRRDPKDGRVSGRASGRDHGSGPRQAHPTLRRAGLKSSKEGLGPRAPEPGRRV